jgi:hypothetical protein
VEYEQFYEFLSHSASVIVRPLREGSVSTVDAKVSDSSSALSFFFLLSAASVIF